MPPPCALSLLLLALQAPPAAPDEPRGLRLAAPEAFQGYTLFAPLASVHTLLVDMQGREVQRWTSEYGPSSVYLLDDGSVLRTAQLESKVFNGGGMCGRVERIGWDGTLLWSYELASEDQMQHHDARPLPNGNVLLIAWEFRYREDCIAAGRDPAKVGEKGMWPDAVFEVRPSGPSDGEIVWEWHAWDHLVQDFDPAADHYGSIPDLPGRIDVNYDHRDAPAESAEEREQREKLEAEMRALGYSGGDDEEEEAPGAPAGAGPGAAVVDGNGPDWMHTNAVDYHAGFDLIALSSPHMNEVWIIDHSTTSEQAAGSKGGKYGKGGDILWRWGNPKNHGAGTGAERRLFYQHNVQWIPAGHPGAGNLLILNNGQQRPGGESSSVDELVLPFDPARGFLREGRAFGPAEPVWSYKAEGFYAPFISGCQRLPNGNTLVCDGPQGRVFEVTHAGQVVWDFWNPFGGDLKKEGVSGHALFRARRIAPDHPGLKGRTLTPREDPAKQ